MITAEPDLSNLPDDERWCRWPQGPTVALVRRLNDSEYIAVLPMIFTHALVRGPIRDALIGYDDRWCYHSSFDAILAGTEWDGTGEPYGWHRHPSSGRRRDEDGSEYVNP